MTKKQRNNSSDTTRRDLSIKWKRNFKDSLTQSQPTDSHVQDGSLGQTERAFFAASTFLSGVLAISASQFLGAPLGLVDTKLYKSYMSWTKESFAVLMITITQWWAPTLVRVSGDASMKDQLFQMPDGTLKCNFPHRLVLMANHQLYTDWLYLWWVAYTNKMHGSIYIIMKESIKQIPILGWAAQFYNFIFLSRKWATDQLRFEKALKQFSDARDPMWLVIFPEGTNLSAVTRESSEQWSKKSNIPDMKHQLLPRTTGLRFCLRQLKASTNWLYDCTIAYEGVPLGKYGQDIFTLRSSFLEGRPPKSVNLYWRRFKISEIPLSDEKAFARWLINRWREKDYILEYFSRFHHFPAYNAVKALEALRSVRKPSHAKMIRTEVAGGGWNDLLGMFGAISSVSEAFSSFDLTGPLPFDTTEAHAEKHNGFSVLPHRSAASTKTTPEASRLATKCMPSVRNARKRGVKVIVPSTRARERQPLGTGHGNTKRP